jgi:hypothetical protein
MAFGFCFLTASNCNSSLVHTLQPQLLLTGINHHARLQVSLPFSNLAFRDMAGQCVCHASYLSNVLCRHVEHLFVSVISKLITQCETINELLKILSGGQKR